MFMARGTRALFGFSEPAIVNQADATVLVQSEMLRETDAMADTMADDASAVADDADLALALGMTPALPPLPSNFKERVLAAYAGDLQAIEEMRAIGDMVPSYMQAAFAEMVEDLVAS